MSTNSLKKAIDSLQKVKKDLNETLKDQKHVMILLGFNADIDRLINRFAFLSGQEVKPSSNEEFLPVTNFMGEEIKPIKELKPEDITPGDEERQIFINKVDRLYADFDTIEPEGILNAFKIADYQIILRGVAKRAGVDGYEDRGINLTFIEEIGKAIKQKTADELEQKEIEEKINNGSASDGLNSGPAKPLSKWNKAELQAELTKREITYDPEAVNKVLVDIIEKDDELKLGSYINPENK